MDVFVLSKEMDLPILILILIMIYNYQYWREWRMGHLPMLIGEMLVIDNPDRRACSHHRLTILMATEIRARVAQSAPNHHPTPD